MTNTQTQLSKDVEQRFDKEFDNLYIYGAGSNLENHTYWVKDFIAQELARKDEEIERLKEKHRFKKCDFCNRKYKLVIRKEEHQSKCYKNPNRVCTLCDGSGLIDEIMNNGYWGNKNYPCPDCDRAKDAQSRKD